MVRWIAMRVSRAQGKPDEATGGGSLMTRRWLVGLSLLLSGCSLVPARLASPPRPPAIPHEPLKIQHLVDDFRARLSIPDEVTVAIVGANPLMVSVERSASRQGAFLLSFEHAFLRQLTEEDLRAVVAHELGHVWIFTHHPFLQTEQLANERAMRLVSRESLARVYEKVWQHGGVKGDLVRFLGTE
jgi:hypothetical protein